jgi:hypothetical protein
VKAVKRVAIIVLAVTVLTACTGAQTPAPAGQTASAGQTAPADHGQQSQSGDGGGATLADAAAKVTDWCTLMPADLAAKIVPGGAAPQSQLFLPLKCTVSNQVSVLEITFLPSGPTDPVPGAEAVPGIAEAAYLERLLPDDAYLTVRLGGPSGAVMYVEVAGHDGKDHKDDAIAVAKAVLAQLE